MAGKNGTGSPPQVALYPHYPMFAWPTYGYAYAHPYSYPCASEHKGEDIGLTPSEQHHHHRTGHHHHYYAQPVAPMPVFHPQPSPHHHHHHPQAYFPQPHYHQHPPYPQSPPAKQPSKPAQSPPAKQSSKPAQSPSNEFWYVPSGQVPSGEARGKNLWHGRSQREVAEDAHRAAHMSGAYQSKEMKPRNAKPDDMFIVIFPDGEQSHISFATIEGGEWKGEWKRDEHGRMYFVKAKE